MIKFMSHPREETMLEFSDNGTSFIENGLTPAAYFGKKVSFNFKNENQLKAVFMLKEACPDFKYTHKVIGYKLNPLHLDRFLAEILDILKPREIEIQCKRRPHQIDRATDMLYVRKLTVNETELEWILTKI